MLRHTLIAIAIVTSLTACNRGGKEPDKAQNGTGATAAAVMVTPEDLITLRGDAIANGPVITGSVQPERRADLRAEVSSVVLQVLRENGDAVKKGDLLVRLDDTSIRDALTSAQQAARASEQAYDQAKRQLERLKTLRASGMASAQALEDAEIRRNSAQSELVASDAKVVQARQQLQRTEVRAPFDGIVSERKVSAGDTAAIGKELVKFFDNCFLVFVVLVYEYLVGSVAMGQPVRFRINGFPGEFSGKIRRIDPAANPTTRQVAVLVAFDEGTQPRVAGLYAEGRIDVGGSKAVTIPEAALVRNGDKAYAWQVKDGVLKKTDIVIGDRDPRRGDYVVRSGLADGDKVVRNPVSSLKDGQKVKLAASAGQGAEAAASATTTKG
ncbi:efflux RND transporter periplasmic adaptor subunit [Oxalobacteraceae bacterium OM1]|nr:efflux RND transporter periplasmic adaptor subunit [Oxalobacteraceae bacterium OM1]